MSVYCECVSDLCCACGLSLSPPPPTKKEPTHTPTPHHRQPRQARSAPRGCGGVDTLLVTPRASARTANTRGTEGEKKHLPNLRTDAFVDELEGEETLLGFFGGGLVGHFLRSLGASKPLFHHGGTKKGS